MKAFIKIFLFLSEVMISSCQLLPNLGIFQPRSENFEIDPIERNDNFRILKDTVISSGPSNHFEPLSENKIQVAKPEYFVPGICFYRSKDGNEYLFTKIYIKNQQPSENTESIVPPTYTTHKVAVKVKTSDPSVTPSEKTETACFLRNIQLLFWMKKESQQS